MTNKLWSYILVVLITIVVVVITMVGSGHYSNEPPPQEPHEDCVHEIVYISWNNGLRSTTVMICIRNRAYVDPEGNYTPIPERVIEEQADFFHINR